MADSLKTICKTCNKSSLSLLLLRPSPIAKEELTPAGAGAVQSLDKLYTGLLPGGDPKKSRTVLRLLRAGYLHVYIPNPPPTPFECAVQTNWYIYRITDNADLIGEFNPLFSQNTMPAACTRKEHNKSGMRILTLPKGFTEGEVWLAYSANLWDETLKNKNAANAAVMQKIVIGGNSNNTFKPTAKDLKKYVMEAALQQYSIPMKQNVPDKDKDPSGKKGLTKLVTLQVTDTTYPFTPINADEMAKELEKVAAFQAETKGKELAVVLADPVGYAAELNDLRVLRHQLKLTEVNKPENLHPLNSSNAILGIQQALMEIESIDAYEKVSPIRDKPTYDKETWPKDTDWQPLTDADRKMLLSRSSSVFTKPYEYMFSRPNMGRVFYPDHDARTKRWIKEQVDKSWKELAPYYDEGARSRWVDAFEKRMLTDHDIPIAYYEADWLNASISANTMAYFEHHFNENDPNHSLCVCQPGKAYCSESFSINYPAPFSADISKDYLSWHLRQSIVDKKAIVKRAIVGNQGSLIATIHQQLTEEKQDKTYDVLKGLLLINKDEKVHGITKYGWMVDTVAGFSVGQLTALSTAAMSLAGRSEKALGVYASAIDKIQTLWGVQQTVDYVTQSAWKGKAPNMPVFVIMLVDAEEALKILRAKGSIQGTSKERIRHAKKHKNKISLTLLTDTDSIKAANGDTKKLLQDADAVNISTSENARPIMAGTMTTAVTEQQFLKLYQQQTSLGNKAANAIKQSMATGSGKQLGAIIKEFEGRLAIGSIIVQGMGLYKNLNDLNTKDGNDLRDAWYGVLDSSSGLIGGLIEMWAVAANASALALYGKEVAAKSGYLASIKILGSMAGVAGGIVNAVSSWAKAGDAYKAGDKTMGRLYSASSLAFTGTAGTSFTLGAGEMLTYYARREGAERALVVLAGRYGAGSVFASAVSGWGLLLLGAGMVFQITAEVVKLKPMQIWMSKSYFGKMPKGIFEYDGVAEDPFKKGDWATEYQALEESLKGAST